VLKKRNKDIGPKIIMKKKTLMTSPLDIPAPELLFVTVVDCRVARWFVFKTKIPIWVNFGGP
jgi:hypothetical protein